MNIDLSIIIVNYNVYEDVVKCINAIYAYIHDLNYEIIVVDSNSTDRNIDNITKSFPNVRYFPLDHNYGFGHANNIAMNNAEGNFFLLMNPDIIIQDNSVSKMIEFIKSHSNVGVVGAVQEKPGSGIEYYYTFFPSLYSRFMQEFGLYSTAPIMKYRFLKFWDNNIKKNKPFKVDWIIASFMLTRKEIYDTLGGFDEAFFLYEEEVDWQLKMHKQGWDSIILPDVKVQHNHHSSTSKFGRLFVNFHEFRSRIVFTNINDKFIKKWIRTFMIFIGLLLRLIYNSCLLLIYHNEIFKKKLFLNYELLKFNFLPRKKILEERYSPAKYDSVF